MPRPRPLTTTPHADLLTALEHWAIPTARVAARARRTTSLVQKVFRGEKVSRRVLDAAWGCVREAKAKETT